MEKCNCWGVIEQQTSVSTNRKPSLTNMYIHHFFSAFDLMRLSIASVQGLYKVTSLFFFFKFVCVRFEDTEHKLLNDKKRVWYRHGQPFKTHDTDTKLKCLTMSNNFFSLSFFPGCCWPAMCDVVVKIGEWNALSCTISTRFQRALPRSEMLK